MKFCTQCGNEIAEGANVCNVCSKPVNAPAQAQAPAQQGGMYGAAPSNFAQPNYTQPNYTQPNYTQPKTTQTTQKAKLTKDGVINIIALVFGIVSLVYAIFSLLYIAEEGYVMPVFNPGNAFVPSIAFIAGMIGYYKSEKKILPLLGIIFSGVYFFFEVINTFCLIS